jgi:hypothetical protein
VSAGGGGRWRGNRGRSHRRAGASLCGRLGRLAAAYLPAAGRLGPAAGRCRRGKAGVGRSRDLAAPAIGRRRATVDIDPGAAVGGGSGRSSPSAGSGLAGAGSLTLGLAGAGAGAGAGALARGRFLRLHGTAQAVAVSLPTDAVGLRVLDRRGVALHADPKLKAKVERFFVCQSQLAGKLVDADLLRQLALRSSLRDAPRALQRP